MNIEKLAHSIWLRVGAPDEVEESAIAELISSELAALPEQQSDTKEHVPEVTHYQGTRIKCTPHMTPIITLELHSNDGFDYYLMRAEVKAASPLPKAETQPVAWMNPSDHDTGFTREKPEDMTGWYPLWTIPRFGALDELARRWFKEANEQPGELAFQMMGVQMRICANMLKDILKSPLFRPFHAAHPPSSEATAGLGEPTAWVLVKGGRAGPHGVTLDPLIKMAHESDGGKTEPLYTAPPLGSPGAVEAAAREILWGPLPPNDGAENSKKLSRAQQYALDNTIAIIRKHMQHSTGWVMVPREPTEAMMKAAYAAQGGVSNQIRAAIAAAPDSADKK